MYRLVHILAILLSVASGIMLLPGAASAGVLDVTCSPPSSDTAIYDPPLTPTAQSSTLTASTQYGPCLSTSVSGLTAGSRGAQNTSVRSCLDLLGAGTTTFTITWNTGQTSAVSGNRTTTIVGAALVVTITGTVTSGLFAGDSVLQTVTGPSADVLLCTAGLGTVSSIYSTVTLEITSI
ncbi:MULTISPECIES: hypothetical protein [unclassified Nonomuraea]|uniref:hypothetical protein n=1 Tax=unclassified Nonomuraea TaxID=2593643 RepID=UPI0033DAF0BD